MKTADLNSSKSNILDTIKLDKALRLAKRKSKDGQLEEAKNIYEDILQKFSDNKTALSELQLLAGVTSVEPQDPPSELLQSIINLYTQGQLQQALSHTTEMLEKFPNSFKLYNIAGASNAGLMQFDAAINSYKQALKIKPDNVEVFNNMGNALNYKGDIEAAINSYKQALKIKPDYAEAYNNMGLVLQNKGDIESAIDNYKQALKIKPDYVDAYCNVLRSSTGSLQPHTLKYLEKVFLRVFKTNENSIIAKFARANLLRHQRKTDLSFKLFCEANKLKKASLETELHSVQVRQNNILEKIKKWKPNKNQLTTNSIKKIFILAPSRSGKTSLEKILRRSKLVHPFYEGVKKNSKIFRDENGKDTFIKQEHRQENYLLTDIFFGNEDQLKSDGYQIVTCTNPDLISAIINLSDLVSNSYFIYVSREQEDLAPEIFIKEYSSGNYHSYDPHSIMVYLRWYKEVWKEFAKKSRDRAFVVSFENVVKSPDEVILGVENFLATDLGIDPIKMNNFNFLRDNEFHNHFKNVLKMVDDRQI